jgi:hypothetical protein
MDRIMFPFESDIVNVQRGVIDERSISTPIKNIKNFIGVNANERRRI